MSLVLGSVVNGATYTVEITVNGTKQTATFTATSSSDSTEVLDDLKSDIEAMTGSHAGITVSKFANELELVHTADMDVHAEGGIDNLDLVAIEDKVTNISDLPVQSRHGRVIKVVLTGANDADYWVKFVAHDGTGGEGYWQETINPTVSVGLDTRPCHTNLSTRLLTPLSSDKLIMLTDK